MNILVCIKHVMTADSELLINASGQWMDHSITTRFEMNKYDTYAVEAALQIKEQFPDSVIDVLTVGPDHAADSIRRALGMGADYGIHITDNDTAYRAPGQTAEWISRYVQGKQYDLILTGMMSEDEMNAQTGPMIAQMSALSFCTGVIRMQLSDDKLSVSVQREIEGGARDIFELRMPCLLTVQTGINSPRYPALSKVLRAKKKELETVEYHRSESPSSGITLDRIRRPYQKPKGQFLDGTIDEQVDQLFDVLTSRTLL